MRTFDIGDRVMVIEDNEIRKGTIKKIFVEFPDILLVEFNDGEVEKVFTDRVALEPKSETQGEQKRGPVEKSEITITPDEFRDTGIRVIVKLTAEKMTIGLAFTAFLAELHKALFFGEVSENS